MCCFLGVFWLGVVGVCWWLCRCCGWCIWWFWCCWSWLVGWFVVFCFVRIVWWFVLVGWLWWIGCVGWDWRLVWKCCCLIFRWVVFWFVCGSLVVILSVFFRYWCDVIFGWWIRFGWRFGSFGWEGLVWIVWLVGWLVVDGEVWKFGIWKMVWEFGCG